MAVVTYDFDAPLWEWSARRLDRWTFVGLPEDAADEIAERAEPVARGFGSLRVEVRIGTTTWRTSIFPSGASGTYVLPVKRAVREREGIGTGDVVHVQLTVLDL